MMELFHKLRAGRGKWRFDQADLSERTDLFRNPARGWYRIYTFRMEQEPDLAGLEWSLDGEDSLALVILDIGAFREKALSQECIKRISKILDFFSENGFDVILRAVYDHEGNAIDREPFFFDRVLNHLRQLGGILDKYADTVFVWQGMLVGNWGEMHTSRFLSEDRLEQMADVLRYYKQSQTYLAVRRPVQWRLLHQGQTAEKLRCPDGMGLFDDGMFGSDTHLGTFGSLPKEKAGWGEAWSREDELAFEHSLSTFAPNGGEAVYGEEYSGALTPEAVAAELRKMRITYLNKEHDGRMLGKWKGWKCPGPGAWAGKSFYDYVGAHLGYRFMVRKALVTAGNDPGGGCLAELDVENTGFGGFYQEGELILECIGEAGETSRISLDKKLHGWNSGEQRHYTCGLAPGSFRLYLRAMRTRDGAGILFAHASDSEGRVYLGRILRNGTET